VNSRQTFRETTAGKGGVCHQNPGREQFGRIVYSTAERELFRRLDEEPGDGRRPKFWLRGREKRLARRMIGVLWG
jgi:hypothetical protein